MPGIPRGSPLPSSTEKEALFDNCFHPQERKRDTLLRKETWVSFAFPYDCQAFSARAWCFPLLCHGVIVFCGPLRGKAGTLSFVHPAKRLGRIAAAETPGRAYGNKAWIGKTVRVSETVYKRSAVPKTAVWNPAAPLPPLCLVCYEIRFKPTVCFDPPPSRYEPIRTSLQQTPTAKNKKDPLLRSGTAARLCSIFGRAKAKRRGDNHASPFASGAFAH